MKIRERITGALRGKSSPVKEIIGRVASVLTSNLGLWGGARVSVDRTRPDYAWWDRFRRGEKAGFELAGLLAKPATEIVASWMLGEGVSAALTEGDEYTDDLLRRFLNRVRGLLMGVTVDLLGLGDQYVIVNPDGSLSVPSPDMVQMEYDPLDYRKAIKCTVTTKLEKVTVSDEYRLDGRTVTIKNTSGKVLTLSDGTSIQPGKEHVQEFENLVGQLPVVHFANERGCNETNGRPMYAALYTMFSWYNDLLVKALRGANRLSNPILAFMGMEDVEETIAANSTDSGETYQDEDGTLRQRERLDIDDEEPVIVLGRGGVAKFIAPGSGFSGDIRNMLKSLYLLFMEHVRIPDVVMGFELSSARASAGEQMKSWYAHITGRRTALEGEGSDEVLGVDARGGLLAVVDLWLKMRALTDRRVVVAPVVLEWPELSEQDAQLAFEKLRYMDGTGRLTDEKALELSGLVENPVEEIEKAEEEAGEKREAFERDIDQGLEDETPVMEDLEAA